MKRFSLVLLLVLALTFVFVGSAFANFGPHGGYATDTDSCAGCHRAHTSFSEVTFAPKDPGVGGRPNALLVGNASTMSEFCYACHGDAAPGASTNVESGVFDGAASTAGGAAAVPSDGSLYVTNSKDMFPLNGGGFVTTVKDWDWDNTTAPTSADFKTITSSHSMEAKNVIIWGAGNGADVPMDMTCTSCHDPHGSSNYRILKDNVNNTPVGGYDAAGNPTGAYVWSNEDGYPVAADKGFLKGQAGADQMALYVPDYTNGNNVKATVTGSKSLSAWCAGCHEGYDNQSDSKDYGNYEANGAIGDTTRHRHPVDITLVQGDKILQIEAQADADTNGLDPRLPLEVTPGVTSVRQNQVGCLTCHLAHGSAQTMQGWASATLDSNGLPTVDATPGVDPDKSDTQQAGNVGTSALLRADNRGVCERCHDK